MELGSRKPESGDKSRSVEKKSGNNNHIDTVSGSPDRERLFIFSTIPNEFIESSRIHRIPDYADPSSKIDNQLKTAANTPFSRFHSTYQ